MASADSEPSEPGPELRRPDLAPQPGGPALTAAEASACSRSASTSLKELAWLFLRLGATSFGGPAAHTAMMEDEVVRRRGWLTRAEFLDLVSACNLIPGPNSTELAIHIGRLRAGWRGLLVAGLGFILPATVIVTAMAWAYVRFGRLPAVNAAFYGLKPVVLVVVLQALGRLGRTAVKDGGLALAGAAALAAVFAGVHELVVLCATGVAVAVGRQMGRPALPGKSAGWLSAAPLSFLATAATGAAAPTAFSLASLGLFFLKVGAVLYGSGYVLLAFLRADLVERRGWLTEGQLLDAVAVGQFTPGPVFTTATFIGYLLGGAPGAIVATVGIFLPAFAFVAISGGLVPRLRRSPMAGAFLDGVNVASLALMAAVTLALGHTAIVDWPTATLAVGAAVVLWRTRVNLAWLILGGAAAGWVWQSLR